MVSEVSYLPFVSGHGLYLTMMLDSVVPGSHVLSALQRLERELAPDDSLLTLYYLLTGRQVRFLPSYP